MGSSEAPTMVETKFSLTKIAEDGKVMAMGSGVGSTVVAEAVAEEEEEEGS